MTRLLCNLRWRDVDSEVGMIRKGKRLPNEKRPRTRVPMTDGVREVLARFHDQRESEGYVLRGAKGGKPNKNSLSRRFKHYARLAKLPECPLSQTHLIRTTKPADAEFGRLRAVFTVFGVSSSGGIRTRDNAINSRTLYH